VLDMIAATRVSAALCVLCCLTGCQPPKAKPAYDIPLDQKSPWPKFRRDARQDALGAVHPKLDGSAPWSFQTGKGIFSSPVLGGDGSLYVGSADRYFYALDAAGKLRWKNLTGEIIDSAALVDDSGGVFVGSGDGHLHAWDAASGKERWSFLADDPATLGSSFSVIRWFEGNVGMSRDGHLIAPNDNNVVYAVDRQTGTKSWSYQQADQGWSLPGLDVATGNLFFGNNSVLGAIVGDGANVTGIGPKGEELWHTFAFGTVAASPVLTSDGLLIVGAFDGYVRAYDQLSGEVRWTFATRDHIYSSPALLPDGTVIQPSTDGTVYALDPKTGAQKWAFDTLDPIRSSPAVDADGNIYVGTGGGQLLVLTKDGHRRWALRLIAADRNDLNASPALGNHAIYLAGEDGNIFSVPYDYCLGAAGQADPRCTGGGDETLPADGAFLWFTTEFGTPTPTPPTEILANDALAFSLYVREGGDTPIALIDSSSLHVTVDPPAPVQVKVSGDRRFLTIVPEGNFAFDAGRTVRLDISGHALEGLTRNGLVLTGGHDAGAFAAHFEFHIAADRAGPMPLPIPQHPGDPSGVWEMYRLAAPLPTILPSYNQIGFDSLHYLVGLVEGTEDHALAWVVGGRLAADQNATEFDPTTRSVFPLEVHYEGGRVTLINQSSFSLEAMSAVISFDSFRLDASVGPDGTSLGPPHLHVSTICGHIPTFGNFLKSIGFCNPQTDELVAFGSVLLRPFAGSPQSAPTGFGTPTFAVTPTTLTASLSGATLLAAAHVFSLLLVDSDTGHPVGLDYGLHTTSQAAPSGAVASVALTYEAATLPAHTHAWLLVDAYPVARWDLPAR
jgi:outer membrane protein assembly factor BamB